MKSLCDNVAGDSNKCTQVADDDGGGNGSGSDDSGSNGNTCSPAFVLVSIFRLSRISSLLRKWYTFSM